VVVEIRWVRGRAELVIATHAVDAGVGRGSAEMVDDSAKERKDCGRSQERKEMKGRESDPSP